MILPSSKFNWVWVCVVYLTENKNIIIITIIIN